MGKLRKDLEVLRSWGIKSIPVDKILSMIDKLEGDEDVITGEDCTGTAYPPCKEESSIDVLFKEVAGSLVTAYPVGGTIFYIDDTADGEYQFFGFDGNLIENVQVGDKPYYYRVIKKGSKDKYYVYHDEVYNNLKWTYCRDKNYVYESLGLSEVIGSGKTNTEKVMAKDSGAYITVDSNGYPTIWYQLNQVRLKRVGGRDDWFIPSSQEIEKLRLAVKSGIITGGAIAGSSYSDSVFNSKWLWSSSECSDQGAWFWGYDGQGWYYGGKNSNNSVFFARVF